MTVEPADWGSEEYCAFYETTDCTAASVASNECTPSCLEDCVDVFCDSMSTLVYACDPSSDAVYADKNSLETQCLNSNAANAETETEMIFSSQNVFDGVSAADMQNDAAAQDAARAAMAAAMSGIPIQQIRITDISDGSRRNLQGNNDAPSAQRRLVSSTSVTYEITAKLEDLGYTSQDSDAAYKSLTDQISSSVSSGEFQQNLKASGQSAGVSTFSQASVTKKPAYSDPVTIAVVTTTPTSSPTIAPTAFSKRGSGSDDDNGLSGGILAVVIVFSVIGAVCLIIIVFYLTNKRKREDLEEQFKQHNFLSRMSSKSKNDSQRKSGGPSVKSFDSIDEQYGVRGKKGADPYGMDIEMESKRQSDLESRRMSEEAPGAVESRSSRKTSRKSDI